MRKRLQLGKEVLGNWYPIKRVRIMWSLIVISVMSFTFGAFIMWLQMSRLIFRRHREIETLQTMLLTHIDIEKKRHEQATSDRQSVPPSPRPLR